MVRVGGAKGRGAKYVRLLEDPTLERWYKNAARGSQITAEVYLRRLGSVCAAHGMIPSDLLKKTSSERRDFLTDLVSSMEERGLSGGYIESTLKAIRSWLSFNAVPWEHRIKVQVPRSWLVPPSPDGPLKLSS